MTHFNVGLAQPDVSALAGARLDHSPQAAHTALRLYERAYRRGWLGWAWMVLTGRLRALLDLTAIAAKVPISHRHYAGIQSMPIQQIQGGEGRGTDFDAAFHPLQSHTQQRWLGLATAWHQGVPLPPIELIRVGDVYFVWDGHHRISAARALGQQGIDAEVTVWQGAAAWPWAQPVAMESLLRRRAFKGEQSLQCGARWLENIPWSKRTRPHRSTQEVTR
jgi:hypothetical protein